MSARAQTVVEQPGSGPAHQEHAAHNRRPEAGSGEVEHGYAHAAVRLSPEVAEEFGIGVATAARGVIRRSLKLLGEVVFNPDRIAHVVPRAPGVVREVYAGVGDHVRAGQVLAVLDSRELARAKSSYLAALARLELAQANFDRKKMLTRQHIAPESEYLSARQALAAARVNKRLATWALYALSLSAAEVAQLSRQAEEALTRYQLIAPISGTIVERHATDGELLREASAESPFVVANLDNVWVHLTVHPGDLTVVRPGQRVLITGGRGVRAVGRITYISPSLSESTRTATARVVVDNRDNRWRPGLFVSGCVLTGAAQGAVIVPKGALQDLEGETVVFVRSSTGFEPRPVEIGHSSRTQAQVVSGLHPGDRYVSAGAFTLKAELTKDAFGDGHGH